MDVGVCVCVCVCVCVKRYYSGACRKEKNIKILFFKKNKNLNSHSKILEGNDVNNILLTLAFNLLKIKNDVHIK